MSTKYSNVLLKLIALSDRIEDKITRNKFVQALIIIGVNRKQDMHLLSTENSPKHPVTEVSIPDSSTDKMSILNALSVNTSLGIILGVVGDPCIKPILP